MNNNDWRSSNKTWNQRIKYILENSVYTDVILSVKNGKETKEFKAHKLILSLSCEVFAVSLRGWCAKPEQEDTTFIEINDIEPSIFELFLSFLYTDDIKLSSMEQAMELYKVAHLYMASVLNDICLVYIMDNLNESTACSCLEFANLYALDNFKLMCLTLIQTRTKAIIANSNFLKANFQTLIAILHEDYLSIREIDLFKGIEKWIQNHDSEMIAQLCQEIIPKIRYFSMTPKEFAEGPVKSGLLESDQWPVILLHLVSDECTLPLPEGFSEYIRKNFEHKNPFDCLPYSCS